MIFGKEEILIKVSFELLVKVTFIPVILVPSNPIIVTLSAFILYLILFESNNTYYDKYCKDIKDRSEFMQNNLDNFDKDIQKEKENSINNTR